MNFWNKFCLLQIIFQVSEVEEIFWGERKECKESPGLSLRNTMVFKSGKEVVIKGHRKGAAAGQEGRPECVGHRSQRNRGFKKAEMLTHC